MADIIQRTGPDRYRVWSTVVSAFIITEATEEELLDYFAKRAFEEAYRLAQCRISYAKDWDMSARMAKKLGVPPPPRITN